MDKMSTTYINLTNERIEYLKQQIDEQRALGNNKVADLFVYELIEENAKAIAELTEV